jgi:hypothetical protein
VRPASRPASPPDATGGRETTQRQQQHGSYAVPCSRPVQNSCAGLVRKDRLSVRSTYRKSDPPSPMPCQCKHLLVSIRQMYQGRKDRTYSTAWAGPARFPKQSGSRAGGSHNSESYEVLRCAVPVASASAPCLPLPHIRSNPTSGGATQLSALSPNGCASSGRLTWVVEGGGSLPSCDWLPPPVCRWAERKAWKAWCMMREHLSAPCRASSDPTFNRSRRQLVCSLLHSTE